MEKTLIPFGFSFDGMLACGIRTLVVLNATKYIIMTDVTVRLNLEESHQQ